MKYKWVVQLKGCPLNTWLNSRACQHDWQRYAEAELCVVHTSFLHGLHSWGWDEERKFILPATNPGSKAQRRLQLLQAQTMARAFNEARIGADWRPTERELARNYFEEPKGIVQ